MGNGAVSGTRLSLLSRLRKDPQDSSAWDEFVRRYGPRIEAWCRRWGLQEADVQDVTQTVLVRLRPSCAASSTAPWAASVPGSRR